MYQCLRLTEQVSLAALVSDHFCAAYKINYGLTTFFLPLSSLLIFDFKFWKWLLLQDFFCLHLCQTHGCITGSFVVLLICHIM